MAIKKINRNQLNSKMENAKIVPVETDVEDIVVEDVVETENVVVEDVVVEETPEVVDIDEEEGEPIVPKVVNKPATKTTKPKRTVNKTNTNKGGNKMSNAVEATPKTKRLAGRAATKQSKTQAGRVIGAVYPKELLIKDIQEKLDFHLSLADIKDVLDATEASIMDACQLASLRFLGGIIKAQDRNVLIAKSPAVDYHSYTGERKVITITGGELGQPDKFRGQLSEDGTKFIANKSYNYETNEWEDVNQEIEINK